MVTLQRPSPVSHNVNQQFCNEQPGPMIICALFEMNRGRPLRAFRGAVAWLCAAAALGAGIRPADARAQFDAAAEDTVIFSDGFEDEGQWRLFEEIVHGDSCYAEGIAAIERSAGHARTGGYGFRVEANRAGIARSNHVIAGYQVYEHGTGGRFRYIVHGYLPGDSTGGQTGPEFSVQNTRDAPGADSTYTVGLQYLPNPEDGLRWNIWHNGAWVEFMDLELEPEVWHRFVLEFDYEENRYIGFAVQGAGIDTSFDLRAASAGRPAGFTIGGEDKGFGPALWVSVECENAWTGCTAITRNWVYYDDISLEAIGSPSTTVAEDGIRRNPAEGLFRSVRVYPNPFNAETKIDADISRQTFVRASVYSISGKRIRTLSGKILSAGNHSFAWDGRDDSGLPAASGIYLFRLDAAGKIRTLKMLLIR